MRCSTIVLLLLSLSFLAVGCARRPSTVVDTDEDEITIATGSEQSTHKVAPNAQIVRDGQPARLDDLQRGDQVRVTTVQTAEHEERVIQEIDAASGDAVPNDGPATPPDPATDEEPLPPRAILETDEAASGIITRVTATEFTLEHAPDARYTFRFGPGTVITADRQSASPDDLREGQAAKVTATQSGQTLIANEVEVTSLVLP